MDVPQTLLGTASIPYGVTHRLRIRSNDEEMDGDVYGFVGDICVTKDGGAVSVELKACP